MFHPIEKRSKKSAYDSPRKAAIHRNALYLSAGAKPELRGLASSTDWEPEECKILPEYSFYESTHSLVQDARPRMTSKGISRTEAQQRVEEFATLISCHNSLAFQTQHNILSRSTSLPWLSFDALLCNALLWAPADHDLSCLTSHSFVGSNRSRVWLVKRCWLRGTPRERAACVFTCFQGHIARYAFNPPVNALLPGTR